LGRDDYCSNQRKDSSDSQQNEEVPTLVRARLWWRVRKSRITFASSLGRAALPDGGEGHLRQPARADERLAYMTAFTLLHKLREALYVTGDLEPMEGKSNSTI
jgi:hypothetical protein